MNVLRPLALASFVLASPVFAAGPPIVPATQPANQNVPAIPEPAALALFVLGAGVVGVAIRRRQN